jgi:predicted nuclease of predicted toxin-antitoxin system
VPKPRLLLDEDVRSTLAQALRIRGFDVTSVAESGLEGTPDPQLLEWAVRHGRAILTHNVRDFPGLAAEYARGGRPHPGIIVSDQVPFKALLARTTRLLSRKSAEDLENMLVWLHNFR